VAHGSMTLRRFASWTPWCGSERQYFAAADRREVVAVREVVVGPAAEFFG